MGNRRLAQKMMLLLGVCLHSLAAASTLITGASVHDGTGAPA